MDIHDILFKEFDNGTVENPNYSMWIKDSNGDYSPATSVKAVKSLPDGVYTLSKDRDGVFCKNIELNTDNLYVFNDSIIKQIIKDCELFWSKKDAYKANSLIHKRGILLTGQPGCGKTALISLLSKELEKHNIIVFVINDAEDFTDYVDFIQTIRRIEPDRNIITIIEDIDKIINRLGDDSYILNLLDGEYSVDHHMVILTSNNTSNLSPALLRPSRIDTTYVIKPPSEAVRKSFLEKKNFPSELINDAVKKSEGFSFASLKELFIGVVILEKDLSQTIKQLSASVKQTDYLAYKNNISL